MATGQDELEVSNFFIFSLSTKTTKKMVRSLVRMSWRVVTLLGSHYLQQRNNSIPFLRARQDIFIVSHPQTRFLNERYPDLSAPQEFPMKWMSFALNPPSTRFMF